MKKYLGLAFLLLASFVSAQQQASFTCNGANAPSVINTYCPNSMGTLVTAAGADTHNLYIIPEGTPGSITVIIQGSVKGDFTDAATCGTSSVTTPNLLSCSGIYTKVRAKVTAFSGFNSVNLTYIGTSSVVKVHDSNAPNGPAGGDLGATYPDPTVIAVNGGAIPLSAAFLASNGSGQLIAASIAANAGNATCWKSATSISYCTSIVAVDGTCTCH